jgi:hypothetical protein
MTRLALFMLLSATAAPSVHAGDAKDSVRDAADFCNQFVINDPDPGIRFDTHFDYHHDCTVYDRDDLRR